MTCLITGCAAYNGHAYVHGDLHQIGNCYVFNAVVRDGETAWMSVHLNPSKKIVDFSHAHSCWERRGTIIALASECVLSDAAKDYIA